MRLVAIAVVVFAAACATEGRDPVCAPGAVEECPCAGEMTPGSQTCSDDGSEWGTCACCTPGAVRGCACQSAGKHGQQNCSAEGEWGACYSCQ